MDEESTAHSPGDCLTILLLTGYDAVQYSEKGKRKRPETTDVADRSACQANSTRNEP